VPLDHAIRRIAAAGRLPWAFLIAALALTVRVPFMFDAAPSITSDGRSYLALGAQLADGRGFADPAFTSFTYRPPAYPLFVAVMSFFPGPPDQAIVIAQHLLGVALAIAVLLVAWRYFGRTAAVIAAILVSANPVLVATEHQVLGDYLLAVFVFLGVASLARGALTQSPSMRYLALAGVLFGVAILTKPIGQALIVPGLLVCALSFRSWRPRVRAMSVVVLGMVVVTAPWVAHMKATYDRVAVSTISEEVLFWRAFDGPNPLPFVGDDRPTRIVRKWYADKSAGKPSGPVGVWLVRQGLIKKGFSDPEVDELQRTMALRAIAAAPGHYLRDSAEFFKTYALIGRPTVVTDDVYFLADYQRSVRSAPGLVRRPVASLSWRALNWLSWLQTAWWTVSFGSLAGALLLLSRDRVERVGALAFLATWATLGVATALTSIPNQRYLVPALPLQMVFGSAGFVFVVRALLSHLLRDTVLRRWRFS
jgi:4-amino-4-deoxy-L-arabinose transferase-like glycosyltransferase